MSRTLTSESFVLLSICFFEPLLILSSLICVFPLFFIHSYLFHFSSFNATLSSTQGHMGISAVDDSRKDIDKILDSLKEALGEAGYDVETKRMKKSD